jgi:hypothetical protein
MSNLKQQCLERAERTCKRQMNKADGHFEEILEIVSCSMHIHVGRSTPVYVCVCVSMRGYKHIYIHAYMHASIHTCMHKSLHTHKYSHTWMYRYIHNSKQAYINAAMHTCTHTHTYTHTYIHICTHACMSACMLAKPTNALVRLETPCSMDVQMYGDMHACTNGTCARNFAAFCPKFHQHGFIHIIFKV